MLCADRIVKSANDVRMALALKSAGGEHENKATAEQIIIQWMHLQNFARNDGNDLEVKLYQDLIDDLRQNYSDDDLVSLDGKINLILNCKNIFSFLDSHSLSEFMQAYAGLKKKHAEVVVTE